MPSRLEQEIRDQSSLLRRRGEVGREAAGAAASLIRDAGTEHLLLAARGSSDNAARFGQYLLGRRRILASLAAPSLFATAADAPRLGHAAAVAVSQSGRSPDVVAVLRVARDQGRPAVAVTNDPASPLAGIADVVLPLGVGAEQAVAATKTYLMSLVALVELADALAPDSDAFALERLAGHVEETIAIVLDRRPVLATLADAPHLTVVGRGLTYSTAMETALKIREVSGILTEAWSPPDLLHGPIAGLGSSGPAVLIPSPEHSPSYWRDVAATIAPHARGLVVIGSEPSAGRSPAGDADIRIPLPAGLPAWVTAVLATVAGQVAALVLGEARDLDVDRPPGLTKVTLTH